MIVPISRRYEPGTLVIETTWVTDTGWVVVHDALTIAEWGAADGRESRPATAHEADHSLLLTMTCIDGEVEMEMECLPRFAYGLNAVTWSGGELGEATEGAIRTCAIIRWPGHVKPGTTSYAMFSEMDFMPTFARMLGAKMPTDRAIESTGR